MPNLSCELDADGGGHGRGRNYPDRFLDAFSYLSIDDTIS